MRLYESLVSNVGIGPHVINVRFFEELIGKNNTKRTDYCKRFVDYIGFDDKLAIKIFHRDLQKLFKSPFYKQYRDQTIIKDYFEWLPHAKEISLTYRYTSEGGLNPKDFVRFGDDMINFCTDHIEMLYKPEFKKIYDKLDTLFKKYKDYDYSTCIKRFYNIKDSIKDLTKI